MSNNLTLFEVRVKPSNGHHQDKVIKMYHILARSGKQAGKKAKKHGRCISVRKVQTAKMHKNYEQLELNQAPYQEGSPYRGNPYQDADPYSGGSPYGNSRDAGRQKRNNRINNRQKDKKGIDNHD
ncbi:hypothetical protein LCGC14_0969250 [marine sediment metagenome]|uniref:Uncharacterized protein n=1 Tax=marine sediment metagenome TaxID=412755 RepID=A0A0F9RIH3_9ZZZZ